MLTTNMLILPPRHQRSSTDMALQPEALIVSNIGETMGMFGSAVVQLAEAVKELNSQQQQQQQQQKMLEQQERQQQHHFLLQKLAEEHHVQLLQHQQQLLQQQQQQLVPPHTLPQVSSDYVPPAVEARLLLMEEVRCPYWCCIPRDMFRCDCRAIAMSAMPMTCSAAEARRCACCRSRRLRRVVLGSTAAIALPPNPAIDLRHLQQIVDMVSLSPSSIKLQTALSLFFHAFLQVHAPLAAAFDARLSTIEQVCLMAACFPPYLLFLAQAILF